MTSRPPPGLEGPPSPPPPETGSPPPPTSDREALLALDEHADRSFSDAPAARTTLPCEEKRGFALTVEAIPPPEFELEVEAIPPSS